MNTQEFIVAVLEDQIRSLQERIRCNHEAALKGSQTRHALRCYRAALASYKRGEQALGRLALKVTLPLNPIP